MFPYDDTDLNTSTGPIDRSALDRSAHVAYHREMMNEKRQRHTDMLPKLNAEFSHGKTTSRQVTQLREENRRFRLKIDELQSMIYEYRQTQTQLERELDSLQRN